MLTALFVTFTALAADSAYTDLSQCKVFDEVEGQYSRATCGRIDRYELIKEYDDEREDISLKWNQREAHLGLGDGSFNRLGPRVEWRLQNGHAYALVARLISEKNNRLYVVRLPAKGTPCVIAEVDGKNPTANETARDLADDPRKTCR